MKNVTIRDGNDVLRVEGNALIVGIVQEDKTVATVIQGQGEETVALLGTMLAAVADRHPVLLLRATELVNQNLDAGTFPETTEFPLPGGGRV